MQKSAFKFGKPQLMRWSLLILGVLLLYFIPAVTLQLTYGPSYGLLSFNNHWVPDDNGGWRAEGFPGTFRPSEPSVNVPVFLRLIPVILPVLLILLLFLNPLSRYVDKEPGFETKQYQSEKYEPKFIDASTIPPEDDKSAPKKT